MLRFISSLLILILSYKRILTNVISLIPIVSLKSTINFNLDTHIKSMCSVNLKSSPALGATWYSGENGAQALSTFRSLPFICFPNMQYFHDLTDAEGVYSTLSLTDPAFI